MTIDARHMRHALALATRGLGTTAPNPSVGCVIVAQDGKIVGRGATQPGGRPHAEAEALAAAGSLAAGATAYVTLEPCSHQGHTGPCAQALIDARVRRVVSACEDPDPRVSGRGHEMLRVAGIEVTTGVLSSEAAAINSGFFKRVRHGLPFVTVKIATSLDGRSALANGASQWITGPEARAAGHALRATHDAILTGIGTVLDDDPQLDCRLPGMSQRSPVRIVADRLGRLPAGARLLRDPPGGAVLLFTSNLDVRLPGAAVLQVQPAAGGGLDVGAMLAAICGRGITRLLVEAGPRLTTSFLKTGAADQIIWFRSASVLGGDARAAIDALSLEGLEGAPRYCRVAVSQWGDDMMETYVQRP